MDSAALRPPQQPVLCSVPSGAIGMPFGGPPGAASASAQSLRPCAGPPCGPAGPLRCAAGRPVDDPRPWAQPLCGLGAALWVYAHRGKRRHRASLAAGATDALSSQVLQRLVEQNPLLQRFLEDGTLKSELQSLQPHVNDDVPLSDLCPPKTPKSPIKWLHKLEKQGLVLGAGHSFLMDEASGTNIQLCAINTNAGIVCGLGRSKQGGGRSNHLAIAQALGCVQWPEPGKELTRVAQLDEAGLPAAQVVEHLGPHMEGCSMTLMQPCGKSWKASLNGKFLGQNLCGDSRGAHPTREAAVLAAGESFVQQVRNALRIPKYAPHAPAEWAQDLTRREEKELLALDALGLAGQEDTLRELLGSEGDRRQLGEALLEATARQGRRIAAMEELSLRSSTGEERDGPRLTARRRWEVTRPEDEDWRREEVKGKLPAERVREELARALEYSQSIIVSGGTGSGKSTQLPQFILDDFRDWEVEDPDSEDGAGSLELEVGSIVEVEFEEVWYRCQILEVSEGQRTVKAKYFDGGDEEEDVEVQTRVRKARPQWATMKPKIVVTQPRRIAATSLAERVAWERYQDECGNEIGYAVRGDTVLPRCETGTIEYCTVGTLLRRLVNDPLLSRYNVIILDEVHERDLMTDFLLNLMREVLPKRPDLRLVLMSATLDLHTLSNYLSGAKVIEVPVGTRYPVEEIHLDDAFFESFKGTAGLLQMEAANRESTGGGGEGIHDFDRSGVEAEEVREGLLERFSSMIREGGKVKEAWERYCSASGSEADPLAHSTEALRVFISGVESGQGDEEEDEEAGISSIVLAEQIQQLVSFSDEARQALSLYREGRGMMLESWDSVDLLAFLEVQGVRPWSAKRASWEYTLSSTWWGSDTNDRSYVGLCEELIVRVAPDMLAVDPDDEIGVGSVLVFLPGWSEIKMVADGLEKRGDADNLWVLKLHSSVEREEQQRIFEPAEDGKVKVILATNIAESSVTINDVRCVIDTGLHREMTYDPKRRMSTLETVWICQSNAVQRKGRAGRVRSGRVYRLYTRDQLESVPWRPAPEMQRCNLAQTCLQTISLGRDPRQFLAGSPDPPSVAAVEAALAELDCIDAIEDGMPPRILPVGQVLSRMPLDPLSGRAMMLGSLFGVPQMTAALLVVGGARSPFLSASTPELRKQIKAVVKEFCPWSDSIAGLRALSKFEKVFQERGALQAQKWALRYKLNYGRLLVMSRQKFQLMVDVQRTGILSTVASEGMDIDEWDWGEDWDSSPHAAAFQESAGAIFEAGEAGAQMDRKDWLDELQSMDREVEDERLLVGILCAAYPTNVAKKEKPSQYDLKALNVGKCGISQRSINSAERSGEGAVKLPAPSWWLYADMKMFNGQHILEDTTLVSGWHVALFSGLRTREEPELELDGWLAVDGSRAALVRLLRQEIRQALVWIAIASSWDRVAQAFVKRSKALLRCLGSAVLFRDFDPADVELVRNWELPVLREGESALQATEDEREEVEEALYRKTVAELKVLLREMGAEVSGKKADLVIRCADALIGGVDQEFGEEVGMFRSEMEAASA